MSSAVIERLHICPGCENDLASGVDLLGKPRLCNACVVARVQRIAAYDESKEYYRPPQNEDLCDTLAKWTRRAWWAFAVIWSVILGSALGLVVKWVVNR